MPYTRKELQSMEWELRQLANPYNSQYAAHDKDRHCHTLLEVQQRIENATKLMQHALQMREQLLELLPLTSGSELDQLQHNTLETIDKIASDSANSLLGHRARVQEIAKIAKNVVRRACFREQVMMNTLAACQEKLRQMTDQSAEIARLQQENKELTPPVTREETDRLRSIICNGLFSQDDEEMLAADAAVDDLVNICNRAITLAAIHQRRAEAAGCMTTLSCECCQTNFDALLCAQDETRQLQAYIDRMRRCIDYLCENGARVVPSALPVPTETTRLCDGCGLERVPALFVGVCQACAARQPEVRRCAGCGDFLGEHEDDSGTHCRWCVYSGGHKADDEDQNQTGSA